MITYTDLQDVARAMSVIRVHECVDAPEVPFARLVSEYTRLRHVGVAHDRALEVTGHQLRTQYPGCRNPWGKD